MKRLSLVLIIILFVPAVSAAGKWSDYHVAAEEKGFTISYHVRELSDGWFVEWKAENRSSDWGEAVSVSRTYTCGDGKSQSVEKRATFGPLPPGENRKMVRDPGICAGSNVEKAETLIELKEVHENVRKMYN